MTNDFFLRRRLTHAFKAVVTTVRGAWEAAAAADDAGSKRKLLAKLYGTALRELHGFGEEIARQYEIGQSLAADIVVACLWGDRGKYVPVDEREDEWQTKERGAYEMVDGEPDARLYYGVPREVRSAVLTAFAMWPYTLTCPGEPVRGRYVSHMARILNHTANDYPRLFVEWFEDMGEGIPLPSSDDEGGVDADGWLLSPQPTRVLRGILFATELKRGGVMDTFWKMAAASERFPTRIFTDPGDFNNRSCLLSPVQFAVLAQFCMNAPEEAVRRFMGAYRSAVMQLQRVTYGSAMLSGGRRVELGVANAADGDALALFPDCRFRDPKWSMEHGEVQRVDLQVTDAKRHWLLHTAVLAHVQGRERYAMVRDILLPGEAKND